jgi:Bacterial low temperature requirement A protein (LtrA)
MRKTRCETDARK